MRINFLSDANWESKVQESLHALSHSGYRDHFEGKNYGEGLRGITVVFICRDKDLPFKPRYRLDRKDRKLFFDIMLDVDEVSDSPAEDRIRIMMRELRSSLPKVLMNYRDRIDNFYLDEFLKDFLSFFNFSK